jgi:hypothetical protein
MSIIFKPNEGIVNTCNLIDQGIGTFLTSRNRELGKFEYEVECFINLTHTIRILESILELARKDLVYIQSALVLTRTLFETLVKVAWILHPNYNFENESRYVSHLNTECELWAKWVNELEKISADTKQFKSFEEGYLDFKNKLSSLLEDQGYAIPKLPNMRELLKALGEEKRYKEYIVLSQFTHMTHYAGKIYRENLGIHKILSEEVRIADWRFVFSVCWPLFETVL